MHKLYVLAISTALGLALSTNASATTHTYNFGTKLNGIGPDALSFASLSFDDVLHKFSLIFNDPTASFGNSAYIDLVAVDYTLGRNIRVRDVNGGVNNVNFNRGNVPTNDYDFVFKIGNGGNRLTNTESVDWISSNFNFTNLGSSSSPFALHVQGITIPRLFSRNESDEDEFEGDENGELSGWYTLTPVPEPETYAMILTGLGVMGAIARRKQKI